MIIKYEHDESFFLVINVLTKITQLSARRVVEKRELYALEYLMSTSMLTEILNEGDELLRVAIFPF